MKVWDGSNYDYDHDIADPDGWVPKMLADGVEAAIIGSQWMSKARWQLAKCNGQGLPVIASYAEPDVDDAIILAQEAGVRRVCVVVEPGGLQTAQEVRWAIEILRDAGMVPTIYGNRGDLAAMTQGSAEFADIALWFAAYTSPDGPAYTEIADLSGWSALWGHQYTSQRFIAGRNRDISEIYEVLDMPDPRVDQLISALAGDQAALDALAGHAALAWRVDRMERDDGIIFPRIVALEAGHEGAGLAEHEHEPGGVKR